jgi:hypothetical protein
MDQDREELMRAFMVVEQKKPAIQTVFHSYLQVCACVNICAYICVCIHWYGTKYIAYIYAGTLQYRQAHLLSGIYACKHMCTYAFISIYAGTAERAHFLNRYT